jgi:hypothetical protein
MSKDLFNPSPSNYNKDMSFVDLQELKPSLISDLKKNNFSLNNDSNCWPLEVFNNSIKTPIISISQNQPEIGKFDSLSVHMGSFMNQTKNGKIMSLEHKTGLGPISNKNTTINSLGDPGKTRVTQKESKYSGIGVSIQKKITENLNKFKHRQKSPNFDLNPFGQESSNFLNNNLNNDFNENNSYKYDISKIANYKNYSHILEDNKFNSQINKINQSTKLDILNTSQYLENNIMGNGNMSNSILNLNENLQTNYFINNNFNSEASKVACNTNQKTNGSIFSMVSAFYYIMSGFQNELFFLIFRRII